MQATTPDELPLVFERHFNAGDVAGLMADYYAPSATYAPLPGEVGVGRGRGAVDRSSSSRSATRWT